MRLVGLPSDMGQRIDVVHPGNWNRHSGPDFIDAQVSVDGTLFRGGIELHRNPLEWYSHGHHLDHVYNQVVLHVAPVPASRPIIRQDGTRIPHVSLGNVMPGWLPSSVVPTSAVACHKVVERHLDALDEELEAASSSYFEELTERLLNQIRPQGVWVHEIVRAVAIQIGSILGAPANRDAMAEAAARAWDSPSTASQTEMGNIDIGMHWRNHCGRPATSPARRLEQLKVIVSNLKCLDPSQFGSIPVRELTIQILGTQAATPTAKIVQATVILPAHWLTATMSGNHEYAALARSSWDLAAIPASPEAARSFGATLGLVGRHHHKSLTWLHRNRCTQKRCAGCRVGNRMVS